VCVSIRWRTFLLPLPDASDSSTVLETWRVSWTFQNVGMQSFGRRGTTLKDYNTLPDIWCSVGIAFCAFLLRWPSYNTSVTLTSLPHTHNRIGSHCSYKSETSCPTLALLRTEIEALSGGWCNDLIMWHYSSHSVTRPWLMTLSCTLVTALVTRDCYLCLKPYFEIGTHCAWRQPPVSTKQELNNNS